MKKRILSIITCLALCLSLLPTAVLAADEITWPEVDGTVTISETTYTYKGDYTSKSLNVGNSNFASTNCVFKAGDGYVLWDYATKKATLHNATITTTSWVLEVPANAQIVVEGTNSLNGSGYAIVSYSGGINMTGTGSITAKNSKTTGAVDAVCSYGGVSINIEGDLTCYGGIKANGSNGVVYIKSTGNVTIEGCVYGKDTISVEAGKNLSITSSADMAIQSVNGKDVSLIANDGNITVSGGRDYSYQWYAIQANAGTVTLDASGNVSVTGYNGYAGVNGSSLALSGTVPANTTLHSTCAITVPAGKTLTNNGTLSVNSGGVTVAGTLVQGNGSAIKSGSTAITPSTTGNGSITEAPQMVDALDFRFDYNIPTTTKEYIISGGGTAKWEPGSNGAANKLTLNGVTMSGTSYLVGVPANTEIVLTGTNKITATSGDAIKAQAEGAVLKISGAGSLEVISPSSGYTIYGASGVDVDIDGALKINGQVRVGAGLVSVKSDGAITVNGSIYASSSVIAEAGTSLSIINSDGAGVFASDCTSVTLTAKNGDLTVQGNGNYAIFGDADTTSISLAASGNLNVSGSYGSNPFSIEGQTLNLDGTIPADTTLYTDTSVVVPAGKVLTNNGTLQLYNTGDTVTVGGILNNYGAIINGSGATVIPTGNGTINYKSDLDFTNSDTSASGNGYEWDAASKTLTLNGYTMDDASIGAALTLPDGAKLVLNEANTLLCQNGAVIEAKGSLEISGTGSLTGSTGGSFGLTAQGDVTIKDCTLNLTAAGNQSSVIATNGNDLTIGGSANVSLTSTADTSWGVATGVGGNFTLESDAKLTIKARVGVLVGKSTDLTATETVKIYGALDTSECASLCANLLGVNLDMQGSSITMKNGTHLWLYQSTDTLTGETDVKAFTGLLRVATGNGDAVDYYKVSNDTALGLYAAGSMVSFTADTKDGKTFTNWTATGVTLNNPTESTISFIMPSNDVTLTAIYSTTVSGVSLDLSELSLTVGDTKTLVATIQPNNATNQNVGWSSDNTEVATVDENGVVSAKKAGTATITVTTADGSKTATCVITVQNRPSGSSGGSSNITTKTEKNDDGSTTTTTTNKTTGTVTETTKYPDGSTTTVVTTKDGTMTTTEKTADGVTGVTKTDADGTVTEITTTVPTATAEEAEESDAAVPLPVEVPAADSTDEAVEVKVNVPSGGAKVEIPVEDVTPGTVVVIVNKDGTEEVVKTSTVTENGVVVTLDKDAIVKVIDNSKNFIDVHPVEHWAEEAIDFVVAREIYSGTSATTFHPDNTMTRGMLAVVLHRLENTPDHNYTDSFTDVAEDSWYEDAIHWAADNGIVGGYGNGLYGPNDNITREQLAVMLWRYAGSPDSSHGLSHFVDEDQISNYARVALAWANENGIINGKGNNVLDPRGNATRAQVAQMLKNFISTL